MQSLGEKEACFVAIGIDGAVEAADGNKRFTRKILGHGLLLLF
jgi:hypothetical protein